MRARNPVIAQNSTSGHHFQALAGNSQQQQQQQADLSRQLLASPSPGPHQSSSASAAHAAVYPITAECNNRCRENPRCRAFLVDYSRHTCWWVEQSAGGGGINQQQQAGAGVVRGAGQQIHLSPTSERTAYFEKICLKTANVECDRAWIFERSLNKHLLGMDDKIIDDVATRARCQEYCLQEREFKCRSGEYDYVSMQCRLSQVDRHMKPHLFRTLTPHPAAAAAAAAATSAPLISQQPRHQVDYFENQCVPAASNQCNSFDRFDDLDLGRAEILRMTNSSEQCQLQCTNVIKAFICRSYTWSPLTGICYLNSMNTQMVGGLDKLIAAPGLIYYQRNDCVDLKLDCDTTSMTLNLRTNEPFRGRMYVRDDPMACETLGRSALISSLNIPFQSQARCATRELPSRYSSIVVVQQHPLIQRKSDRYIKLVCDFQTSNRTITSAYNVATNPWTSTAVINATSMAPKIRLRITDKFGNDITGAKLGDELQLRIEAESESVYDMVARSVLAKSGITDESIVLIDRDGCPADYRIFPPLRKLNKRVIIGKFDAFKFSSDVVVRFQVDVQFCLNSCPPTNCDQSQQSNSMLMPMSAPPAPLPPPPVTQQTTSGDNQLQPQLINGLDNYSAANSLFGGAASAAAAAGEASGVGGPQAATGDADAPQPGDKLAAGDGPENSNAGQQQQQMIGNQLSSSSPSQQTIGSINAAARQRQQQQQQQQQQSHAGLEGSSSLDQFLVPLGQRQQMTFGPAANQQQHLQYDTSTTSTSTMASEQQLATGSGGADGQALDFATGLSAAAQLRAGHLARSQSSGGGSADFNQQQQQHQAAAGVAPQPGGGHARAQRQRRSAELMPETPRHVPLQREIIVVEAPDEAKRPSGAKRTPPATGGSGNSGGTGASGGSKQDGARHKSSASGFLATNNNKDKRPQYQLEDDDDDNNNNNNQIAAAAVTLNPSMAIEATIQEPTTGNQQQAAARQQQKYTATPLVCTNWSSLVLASFAFCALQLLTIGLFLANWLHKQQTAQQTTKTAMLMAHHQHQYPTNSGDGGARNGQRNYPQMGAAVAAAGRLF